MGKHIRSVFSLVAQEIGLLRKSFRVFGDQDVLLRCFNFFILPSLEYSSSFGPLQRILILDLLDKNFQASKFLIPNLTIVCFIPSVHFSDIFYVNFIKSY